MKTNDQIIQALTRAPYRGWSRSASAPRSVWPGTWFRACVEFIQVSGRQCWYWGREIVYYDYRGYRYWIDRAPLCKITSINRMKLS